MKKEFIVFYISIFVISVLVITGIIIPDALEEVTSNIQTFFSYAFGWYYLILVSIILVICLYFLISPLGRIKLGRQDEKPEFSTPTWIAMLFSAGMGIGLVFYGASEPISHYAISSPTGEVGTVQGIKDSLRFTYFHWGIHAWGIYAIVSLSIAYFQFRHNKSGLISATLQPIFGDKVNGVTGKAIDVFSVLATVLGVAASLGFGAVQINGGLAYLFDLPKTIGVQTLIIAIVTVLFLISAWSGLGKGIKILSNTNMILAAALFLLMFILGPTLFILNLFTNTIGTYIQTLPQMSFRIAPLNEDIRGWINSWTIFYWAWWIAWSPFVGIFIARVSRGRSIREFVFYVLLIPSLIVFLWFSAFGGTAILLEHNGVANISSLSVEETLFGVFSNYPFSIITSFTAMVLIGSFFITSADSGTYVLGMMTTNGSIHPGNKIKFTWGILLSAIALVLLYSGGLQAVQNMMIIAALPFSIIVALMTFSLIKALREEAKLLGIGQIKKRKA